MFLVESFGYIKDGVPITVAEYRRAVSAGDESKVVAMVATWKAFCDPGKDYREYSIPKFGVFGLFRVKITIWVRLSISA